MRLLYLLLFIKLAMSDNQLAMMNMPTITNLDVQCERSGMTVTVEFSQDFDGIIFSKGHYSNPACRYVSASSSSSFTFEIPSQDCGSEMDSEGARIELSNTIIIQNDPEVQEIWDTARAITCSWIENLTKKVKFNPFSVGMLTAEEVVFEGDDSIDCWMDIQLGVWPDTTDINSIVKIGDTLSLLIFARDNDGMYDVSIKDCYAFGSSDYDDGDTPKIQLTDENGCVIKDKLISEFATAHERDQAGSILIKYALTKAFKFPDAMEVYMTCNMDICKGGCEQTCQRTTTTEPPRRYGSTLFGEPITTTQPTTKFQCHPGSTDPRCAPPPPPSTTTFRCYPGLTDPRCPPPPPPTTTTTPAPKCYPGSYDPRCPKPPTTTAAPLCYPGSRDPRCPKPTTTPAPSTTTTSPPRSGSILYPITQTTKPPTKPTYAPILKPKPSNPIPNRINPEPKAKPEPTGKEWEGESRFHAFHSFHYDKGDGRRSRKRFGDRLKRSLGPNGENGRIQLTQGLVVAPIAHVSTRHRRDSPPVSIIDYSDIDHPVCLSYFTFLTIGFAFLFIILLFVISYAFISYFRPRKGY